MALKERSNDEWLAALRGPKRDEALAELRAVLVRGLRGALGGQANRAERPPARGWKQVAGTLEHAASYFRDGDV